MLKENKKTFLSNEIIEKKKFEEIERLGPEYTASVQHNSRFFPRETLSVNLSERIKQNLQGKTKFQKLDLEMSKELKKRFESYKSFDDIKLAYSVRVPLSEIAILPTMQRLIDNNHLYGTILSDFRDSRAMVPSCVKNPITGKYQNWDGQHTLCALERIATAKGWSLEECYVWINVYQSWEDLRDNILAINGPGKKPFTLLDKFEQHVYAVRQDGSTNPIHLESEQIQSYAEQFGIFYCEEKSSLEIFPGAQSMISGTIMSDTDPIQRPKPIVTKWFGGYYSRVVNNTGARPVQAKEARQMYVFFDLCEKQNINIDEFYLDTLSNLTIKSFKGDFSSTGIFWSRVEDSYNKWYRFKNPNDDKDPKTGLVIVKGFSKEKNTGIPFLIALIKKHTKLNVPVFESKTSSFIPADKDLF